MWLGAGIIIIILIIIGSSAVAIKYYKDKASKPRATRVIKEPPSKTTKIIKDEDDTPENKGQKNTKSSQKDSKSSNQVSLANIQAIHGVWKSVAYGLASKDMYEYPYNKYFATNSPGVQQIASWENSILTSEKHGGAQMSNIIPYDYSANGSNATNFKVKYDFTKNHTHHVQVFAWHATFNSQHQIVDMKSGNKPLQEYTK